MTTRTDLLDADAENQGTIRGRLPAMTFAFHMEVGHSYTIEHLDQALGGVNHARVWVTARDVAPDGKMMEVRPVTGVQDLAACKGGQAGQGGQGGQGGQEGPGGQDAKAH